LPHWLRRQIRRKGPRTDFGQHTISIKHESRRIHVSFVSAQFRGEIRVPAVGKIDEADKFIRLPITTRAEGFSLGSSKRATDMLMKVELLADRNPGRPIVSMYTGTPWRNSLAESFVWQRFLQPERLEEVGLQHFDSWAATFVRYETKIEVAPDGSGFRAKTRPSTIQNYPELRRMLREFADLVSAERLGQTRPRARYHHVVSEPTQRMVDYVSHLVDRAEACKGRRAAKGEDNILAVTTDGRKLALDPHLLGISEDSPKLKDVAETVAKIYRATLDADYGSPQRGALQLVLCDFGTPKSGDSSSYGRLRRMMQDRGIPANRIRFVHEATTDKARSALFAACRDGSVSVLIGSTPKVGIGTNIQTRLIATHEVAPPWRQSDVQQGRGRSLRPGNLNDEVDIYTYVVEGTFDAYMWQTLHRKARAFELLYSDDDTIREVDDIGGAETLSFAEIKALASGNSLLLEQAEAAADLRRLRMRRTTHMQNVNAARQRAADARETAAYFSQQLSDIETIASKTETFSIDLTLSEVERLLEGRDAYPNPFRLRVERDGDRPPNAITIMHGYRTVDRIDLPPKVVRRGAKAVRPLLSRYLKDFAESFHSRPSRLRAAIERGRAEAHAAQAAADNAVFADEAALAAAERRADAIDAAIEAEIVDKRAA
jgi:hypothetical protein